MPTSRLHSLRTQGAARASDDEAEALAIAKDMTALLSKQFNDIFDQVVAYHADAPINVINPEVLDS